MLFTIKLIDYNIIFFNLIILLIISTVLLFLNDIIKQKSILWDPSANKYAAYECGFEPFSETHVQIFEIQFFLVSIMFLIFDIELALIFPWASYLSLLNWQGFWLMMFFLLLLTLGFFYEWRKGALNWHSNTKQNV